MAEDKKVVTEEEIKRIDAELKQKGIDQRQAEDKKIEKLLDAAVSKGKDEAKRLFEEEQSKVRAEEERKQLLDRISELEHATKRTEEAALLKMQELSKSFEEKVQELQSKPKGISRNESPFAQQSQGVQPIDIRGLTREQIKEVEKNSMDAFYASLGRVPPQ